LSAKRKAKTPACVPQSWEEADKLMAEYGELSGKIVTNQAECEAAVAKVMAPYQETAAPMQARMDEIFEAIECYAAANRKKLTDDGKTKTVTMTAGSFGWRLCPPSVAIPRALNAADVVKNIRALIKKLRARKANEMTPIHLAAALGFIRIKEEPNKAAMLDAPETAAMVEDVSIVTDKEEFFLDPTIAELPEPK
jgi:phage host-nuclease inhibitor protein Gam